MTTDPATVAAHLTHPAVLAVGGSRPATPTHPERGGHPQIRRLTNRATAVGAP
ncbi:hypothetical protein ACIRVF_05280 [Kitasatospora sp. NPDC101157]|uniref:hypothetical protein n=1 Tax=Kitasatospora sp. NPDC101157 TaxID=3364098 RepID=UPI00381686C7